MLKIYGRCSKNYTLSIPPKNILDVQVWCPEHKRKEEGKTKNIVCLSQISTLIDERNV
jgi:hypothetical protein